MTRAIAALGLLLSLIGCTTAPTAEPPAPSGNPVQLMTYFNENPCRHQLAKGLLLPGAYGTDIRVVPTEVAAWPSPSPGTATVPVQWPLGFTGQRLVGGEIAVLNGAGKVVATTGRSYWLEGGWLVGQAFGPPGEPPPPPRVAGFVACGDTSTVIPH